MTTTESLSPTPTNFTPIVSRPLTGTSATALRVI